jgi:hypothetical protein
MQRDGIAHAGEGEREGFAEALCAAGDKGEGLGHGGIVNEKPREFKMAVIFSAIPNLEPKTPKTTNHATDFTEVHGFFCSNPCKSA